jgi:uncharacterized protein
VRVLTVSQLSVTPVKALGLHHPDEITLGWTGVPEDRRFYLVDHRGRRFNGMKFGRLVAIRPTYDPDDNRLTLTFPDGEGVTGEVRLGEPITTTFYGPRRVPGHLVEGPWNEALSRYAGRPVRLARVDRDGEGVDVHPVTLVSEASVDELNRQAERATPLDVRRFRMLVTIAGGYPHQEDDWIGHSLRVGDATVHVPGPVPRCVVTNQDPDTGRKDAETLRAITAYRGTGQEGTVDFGVYGTVVEPGRVRVGDEVSPP